MKARWSGLFLTLVLSAQSSFSFADSSTLVLGRVSDNPEKALPRQQVLADYLLSQLKDHGIRKIDVIIARNNQTMINYLRSGRVDLISETPFSAALYMHKAAAAPIAHGWRKGKATYQSILFAREDSGIRSIQDLQGRTIAFEDPGSTSAYFVPAAMLLKQGFAMTQLESPRQKPPGDEWLGYVFSGSEINSSTWVYRGLVDAAVVSDQDWIDEDDVPSAMRNELRIIHRSPQFPRSLFLVNSRTKDDLKRRITEILLQASESEEGKQALYRHHKITRYTTVTDETRASLRKAKELLYVVKDQLE